MPCKLENWSIVLRQSEGETFLALPEDGMPCLRGRVFGHHRIEDGEVIITSPIFGYDPTEDVVRTHGNAYVLGDVDPEYEKAFPGASQRIKHNTAVN